MPGKDLYPDIPDDKQRSRFRHSTNRKVEIILQQELDDVAKKSITQIHAFKEARRNVPLTEEELNVRKLAPEFTPRKLRETRKTKPVFHETVVKQKEPKSESGKPKDVPVYNPLDREGSIIELTEEDKFKKYPFTKEPITVEEVKKAHKSSVGIVPTRQSDTVPGLKVVLTGQPPVRKDLDPVLGPVERANTAPLVAVSKEDLNGDTLPGTPKPDYKPAIVGIAGTLQAPVYTKRPEPPLKPRTFLKSHGIPRLEREDSVKSDASSFASVELAVPEDQARSQIESAMGKSETGPVSQAKTSEGRKTRTDKGSVSVQSIKSTKDLLEEAKQISGAQHPSSRVSKDIKEVSRKGSTTDSHGRRLSATKSRVNTKLGDKRGKGGKGGKSKQVHKEEEPSTERTVDEIIAMLKENAQSGVESESDKKIQSILNKVIKKRPVGDLDEELRSMSGGAVSEAATEQEPQGDAILEEGEEEEEEEVELAPGVAEQAEEPQSVEGEKMIEALERLSQEKTGSQTQSVPEIQVQFDEEEEGEEEEDVEEGEVDETLDLEQAWRDLNLPQQVTYEDVVSIQAKPMALQPRGPKPTEQDDKPLTTEQSYVSFLGSWAPVEREPAAAEVVEQKPVAASKNVHHFCTATEDIMLPDHYRGTWRRYHVPSKFDNFFKAITKDQPLPSTPVREPTRGVTVPTPSTSVMHTEDFDQKRSAAAVQILQEANNLEASERDKHNKGQGDMANQGQSTGDFESWRKKAQEVFEHQALEVDGQKMPLKSDESYLYWTPAPPKWDITPAQVKKQLFPQYGGAATGMDIESTMVTQEDLAESEEEEETQDESDPEEKANRQRTLGRTYPSMQDLTQGREPPGSTRFMLMMDLDMDYEEAYEDPESNISKDLATRIQQQIMEVAKIDPRLRSIGIIDFKVVDGFSRGSVMFKLAVHTTKPVKRAEIADLSQWLKEDIETYGPLEINGQEVHLAKDLEVVPTERMSALEMLRERTFEGVSLPSKMPRGATPYMPRSPERVRKEVTENVMELNTKSKIPPIPRTKSAPGGLDKEDDDILLIMQDFDGTMEEIGKQKKQLKQQKKLASQEKPAEVMDEVLPEPDDTANRDESLAGPTSKMTYFAEAIQKADEPTAAELALQAGRSYVLLPKKSQKKKPNYVNMESIERLEHFLAQKPNKISRRESFVNVKKPVSPEFRVPPRVRRKRNNSLPGRLQFETYKKEKFYKPADHENEREWVRHIWNRWFDQVFPPTPVESDWSSDEESEDMISLMKESPVRRASVASTVYSTSIEVNPVILDEDDEASLELLEEELEILNTEMEAMEEPRSFDYCRRGAIYRKLGKIKEAIDNLNKGGRFLVDILDFGKFMTGQILKACHRLLSRKYKAIEMEPLLVDAYWHRHLVYMLLNKKKDALEDLNFILRTNKSHREAYKSRARIFRAQGDITMAIVNYTQAIKLDKNDYESFFQRAEMYEKRGEMLLAMEDYATATKISPHKTEALYRHGLHYFKNKNWKNAIQDFTNLLKRKPTDAKTRLLRGRAYVQMTNWNKALEDMSGAIHLDPKNAKAFYYRGCILRKLHPKRALQDFSISLLLDDSEDNILSYLHRGILYNDIGKHEDAIPDFEAVLKLNKDMATAHVNLGLIYMLKMENHHRAIKKFSNAMKADPTYVKAYVCRAEAFTRIHDIKNALLDITRAIHIRPDVHHYYMMRGELVRKLGDLDLAAFCVKHAADLDEGLGQSPTQKAIVQSFLKNYDKAVDALEGAARVKPSSSIFVLLGKTLMKSRSWTKAVESFERALELVKPWQRQQAWPLEAAEMYYLIGMCQKEMRDFGDAHEAFNNAILVDKKYAEAYYQRGLCKVKLKLSKGIQDFNRALALRPKLFEAYLSRAAYYGLKKQYTKAILNCNEAIRLQPDSVRSYLYRGALKYHIKAYSLAIRDLSHAINIDNKCTLAYFNRAVCHQDSGNWQKALQDYGIVMLLGEDLKLKVLINRGLLYFERKDYRNALHDFLIGVEVFPRDKQIHHTLGLCYHKLDQLDEAIKSFTRALELDQFFLDALISRGNVFMDFQTPLGHMYAKHDYERALHVNPLCLPARVNLAYTLQVAGKYQQAWHQFTKAIKINPRFKPALEGRAIINLQMSDTFAAYQDICGAISVRATAELLTNRGVIHQFMGERSNAMRDYQAAIKLDSEYGLAFFNAANMYFHMRQFKQALEHYDIALKFNTKDESAYLNRAISKVMLKDSRGALADFDKAIKLSPYSAHIYFNRANMYASLGMYQRAEEDYTMSLKLHPDDPLVLKRRADVRGKLNKKELAIEDYRHAVDIQSWRRR